MARLSITWHYYNQGDPGGIPVLFLHGFMGSGQVWLPTMQQLLAEMYSIAVDLPGHGNTVADLENLDFDSLSDGLIDFIDIHIGNPVVLVGYSLGGRIALHAALKYPDRFIGLALESTTAGIENDTERLERLSEDKVIAEQLRRSDMATFLTNWYKRPVFASLPPYLKEGIINRKIDNHPENLARILVRLSQGIQPPLWHRLCKWDKPTLIVAGEKDKKYTDIAARMSSLIESSALKIIPGAGHIAHLENNKEFTAALNSFLGSYIL